MTCDSLWFVRICINRISWLVLSSRDLMISMWAGKRSNHQAASVLRLVVTDMTTNPKEDQRAEICCLPFFTTATLSCYLIYWQIWLLWDNFVNLNKCWIHWQKMHFKILTPIIMESTSELSDGHCKNNSIYNFRVAFQGYLHPSQASSNEHIFQWRSSSLLVIIFQCNGKLANIKFQLQILISRRNWWRSHTIDTPLLSVST